MADVWQFSESSQDLLENCLAISRNINKPNQKFLKIFRPTAYSKMVENATKQEYDSMSTIICEEESEKDIEEVIADILTSELTLQKEEQANKISSVLEVIPSNKLDYLISHCNKDDLLPIVAEKLSTANLETIGTDLFNRLNVDVTFAHKFVTRVFPAYLKRKSALTIDLLIKAHDVYPEPFKILISSLLLDTESPNKILEQFFLSVKRTDFSEFLQEVSMRDLTKEVFMYHLNTFYCLYKNSQKTFDIQVFILRHLVECSKECSDDKIYGKFMLSFFQGVKESDCPVDKQLLETLLNNHRTMFKKLCSKIFDGLK